MLASGLLCCKPSHVHLDSSERLLTVLRWCALMRVGLAVTLACALGAATPAFAAGPGDHPKLDKTLNERTSQGGKSRVIVILKQGWSVDAEAQKLGGKLGRSLGLIDGKVVELPNGQLRRLADYPGVARIVEDRSTAGEMNRVAVTVGARAVQQAYGYSGSGVGVAIIDSGITSWHDDLTYRGNSSKVLTVNGQRVAAFVDFVNGHTTPYDDSGHGTHVAGIVAGNGYDSTSNGRAGIAPNAHLVSLKVLDAYDRGVISNVIAALEWAIAHKTAYNLRVINLSVGAPVRESYNTDPLTLAAKRAVDAGLVVVTASGNHGKNSLGQTQYGAISAPGNAPWVITVGASSHESTVDRTDDAVAGFSSRGPSAIDYHAKPDLVAPGVGTVSLSNPLSLMYTTKAASLLSGSVLLAYKPYLSLSGTSMSAPVVAGSVALMLQANPTLTPNLVKAILEYTAQVYPGYNALTQGAGFLNTKGAVDLAQYFKTALPGQAYPQPVEWSKKVIWGNHRISHGAIQPAASAWRSDVVWGAATDPAGAHIACGMLCDDDCDNVVWGTSSDPNCDPAVENCDNVVWGTSDDPNCDPAVEDCDNVVWGTAEDDDDNVVWGTDCDGADCDNVVWGTAVNCDPTVEECDNVVWGTMDDDDNVTWGTSLGDCNPLVEECDNVVWGTSGGAEFWTDEEDNVTWGTAAEETTLYDDPDAPPACFDSYSFEELFGPLDVQPLFISPPLGDIVEPVITDTTVTLSGGIGGIL
jgi:serine protease AprX